MTSQTALPQHMRLQDFEGCSRYSISLDQGSHTEVQLIQNGCDFAGLLHSRSPCYPLLPMTLAGYAGCPKWKLLLPV